jgi:hypothetical protein
MRALTIEDYIRYEHRSISESNAADYKPTSKHEIDEATKLINKYYEQGKKLIAEIGHDEVGLCKCLYDSRHEYGSDYLIKDKVLGQWVIVPQYVTLIAEVRKLKEIFK